ncbi:MAG: 4Fe-4S dicluster domain-containing protein [Candidatus Omnitrophota bacterium]
MNYITTNNFYKFLEKLKKDYQVYIPIKKDKQRFYERYDSRRDDIVIGEVRAFEPLKSFFTRAREKVSEGFKPDLPHSQDKPLCIVGAKSCDLKGFKVQDHVFKDKDNEDPFYAKLREENLIISADCTCSIDTCFCLAADIEPYPKENFDINLSQVEGGFIVESGSKKGELLINKHLAMFENAKKELVSERDAQRERAAKGVEENIKSNNIPSQDSLEGVIEKKLESGIWEDEAKACVECGACTIICPTCHCFLLYDQKNEDNMARLRVWDSCMIKDYARVAGGANPRPRLWMRLRNRFEKKFDFFPKVAGIYACTGCGRCISACPAKIDIRKVLRKLVS